MPGTDSCSFAILPQSTYLLCFMLVLCMSHFESACCAATTGMPVSEQNCHPFQWGRYLFMHNGECLLLLYLQERFVRRPVSSGVVVSALARLSSVAGLPAAQYNPSLQSYHPCVSCLARRPERLAFTPVSRQAWWAGSCALGALCWQRCPMPPMTLCRCRGFWSSRLCAKSKLFPDEVAHAQSFHSDSAICFSIFLHHLPSLSTVQTPQALLQAMEVRPAAPAEYLHTGQRADEPAFFHMQDLACWLGPQKCVRMFCRRQFTQFWQPRKLLA